MWPTQELQIEHSIESLKVQLANDAVSPHIADAKAILQSILWSLSPHRGYKEMTAALAQQAVHVAVKISALIETTNEMPQLVKHCLAQFEETLRDIQYLIQFATQSSTLYDPSKFLPSILARYTVLEERLGTLLVHFEQYIINLQSVDSVLASHSRIPSLHNGDVLRSGEMFSNAHDLTINGGYYYSGQIFIQQPPPQESTDIMRGIVQGTRVIAFEDISVSREIHTNRGYRLHSDNTSGKARVVKVYQGPQAKERCLEAAKFHQTVMHPSFLHMIGVSPINSEVPFLVFNGELAGSLEASIAAALKKDVRNSLMLGLQTVIGLSSGLDYLRDVNYDFISAGLQHFGVFLTIQGTVLISFDPYTVCQNTGAEGHEEQGSSSEVDKSLFIFHELCKQTFDAACQTHYNGQHIERAYDDILENGDRFEDVNGNSSLENENHDSNPSRSVSPLHQTVLDSAMPSIHRPRKRPASNGHRRELVWKSESAQFFSLKNISHVFKTFLDDLPTSSGSELYRRRGRYTARIAHRCPGYNRTEITLTPNITRSAIVTHSTPLPREICPVCKQVVKDAEKFNCICGGEDNEYVPTIQCSRCYEWHHRPCVAGFEFTDQCFTCPVCSRIKETTVEHEFSSNTLVTGGSFVTGGVFQPHITHLTTEGRQERYDPPKYHHAHSAGSQAQETTIPIQGLNNGPQMMYMEPSTSADLSQHSGSNLNGYPLSYVPGVNMNMEQSVSSSYGSPGEDDPKLSETYKLINYHLQNYKRNLLYVLPASLRPTIVQRTIPHEIFFDLVIHPELRDRMILMRGRYEPLDCILDLYKATIIHGDDVLSHNNWEIREEFLRKYWFLIDITVLTVSNKWRRERGEPELTLSDIIREQSL